MQLAGACGLPDRTLSDHRAESNDTLDRVIVVNTLIVIKRTIIE